MRNPFSAFMPTNKAPVSVGAPAANGSISNPLMALRSGRVEDLRQVETGGLVFSIIRTRANRLAGVGWDLVRLERNGSSSQKLEDAEVYDRPHIANTIWSQPNPFFPRTMFIQAWSTYWDLLGEAYIAPTFVGKIPMELWLLEPERMTPVPDPAKYLLGWGYRTRIGSIVPMKTDEVWQQRFPNPNDIYRGLGAVQAASTDIAANKKSAAWNLAFFANSAEPGAVIETENPLTKDEYERLKAQLKGHHQGINNAHKTLVLEKGKYNFRSPTQRDMQFTEGRQMGDEQIRQAFGISKTNLGVNEDVNRATAETGRDIEAVDHTEPKLVELQTMLNQQFLPRFGGAHGLAFRFANPRPDNVDDDTKIQAENTRTFTALVNAGADPMEAAEALNLPEVSFTGPVRQPRTARLDTGNGDDGEVIEIEEGEEGEEAAGATAWVDHVLALADTDEPETDEPSPELRVYQDDYEAAIARLQAAFDSETDGMIAALIAALVAALGSDNPAEALTEIRIPSGAAADVIAKEATALAETSIERAKGELAKAEIEPVDVEPATASIKDEAVVVAALIAAALVTSGITEAIRVATPTSTPAAVGESVDQFLRGLTGASRNAQLAARLAAAQQQARLDTFEAVEDDAETDTTAVVWRADETLDSNTCGPCKAVANRIFETIQEARASYPSGGYRACDGRDRCRGTVLPVVINQPG